MDGALLQFRRGMIGEYRREDAIGGALLSSDKRSETALEDKVTDLYSLSPF